MIPCADDIWVNPRHVVTAYVAVNGDTRIRTISDAYVTPLPIETVIGMVAEANS